MTRKVRMEKEAALYEALGNKTVHCFLCAHECRIQDSKFGFCGVRRNRNGKLYTLVYNEPIAAHLDPIEKKPFYHFLPGTFSYSVATIGCNFHCGFCQNWQISQLNKRDERCADIPEVVPEEIVAQALAYKAESISYTYTEPTIFFEYAHDIAELAKARGLLNVFVTNGYMTQKALTEIQPYLNAANVDLKSFSDEFYRKTCAARLAPVLDSIRNMRRMGIWVEVTTLLIPGVNDSDGELEQSARFLADVDQNMPWHISRFHPDYRMTNHPATPVEALRRARDIGRANGLRYIYLGNVLEGTDTLCPKCGELLIARNYMHAKDINLNDGTCPRCQTAIPGIWRPEHEKK